MSRPKIGLLFPGQGSQYVGMGKDLLDNFSIARETFEQAGDALHEDMRRMCLEGPEDRLRLTANTQPAILTLSVAAWRVLQNEAEIRPVCAAGHSLGEYSALTASGAVAFEDAVVLVRKRGELMQDAVPEGVGAMAAVMGLDKETVEEICKASADSEVVCPANYNAPGQIVISGHATAVERASAAAKEKGAKKVIPLNVSAPFHSPLLVPAGEQLSESLQQTPVNGFSFQVISNVEAEPYPSSESVADLLTRQISHPVRWQECMERAEAMEVDLALELGPKKVLVGLMKRIAPGVESAQMEDTKGLKALLNKIGQE